jgi:hypothetical protein
MGQCNHEEADTRIIVHLRHALEESAESLLVRTVDTDVVVILVGKLHDLLACNQRAKLWVAFGMGCHYSLININSIYYSLGVSKSRALPVFHASLDVIAPHNSVALARRPPGKHGSPMGK